MDEDITLTIKIKTTASADDTSSGGDTAPLIYKCTELRSLRDDIRDIDYTLDLDIITQTVQAVGHTNDDKYMAVEDAWNWDPSN